MSAPRYVSGQTIRFELTFDAAVEGVVKFERGRPWLDLGGNFGGVLGPWLDCEPWTAITPTVLRAAPEPNRELVAAIMDALRLWANRADGGTNYQLATHIAESLEADTGLSVVVTR